MKKWHIVMVILVVFIFGGVIAFNFFLERVIKNAIANKSTPQYPVTTMKVQPTIWYPFISSIGYIKPSLGVQLKNEQSGSIKKINFTSGEWVEKGRLLVALDSDVEEGKLKSAEGQLYAIKAHLQRIKELYAKQNISLQELEKAEANFNRISGEIQSLKGIIERRIVRAPFSGHVGILNLYAGQFLSPGSDIVRIENTDTMQIQFSISQNDYARITKNLNVKIYTDAYPSISFNGMISAIEPAVDSESGVVKVLASIPNNNGQLRSGMFAQVKIKLSPLENCIAIPQQAISFQLYGQSVYVVLTKQDKKSKELYKVVKKTLIKAKDYKDNLVLINSGLHFGDEIVLSGQMRLNSGSRVRIADAVDNQTSTNLHDL